MPELPVKPPDFLDPVAVAEYNWLRPILTESRIATALDRAILCVHCCSWSVYVTAQQAIAEQGALLTHPNGHRYANPALRVAKLAAAHLHAAGIELAMTPLSRVRLKIPPLPRETDLDKFRRLHSSRRPRVRSGDQAPDHGA